MEHAQEIFFVMNASINYYKKETRRAMFKIVHCYLRMHSELLEDSLYQKIYDHHRKELVLYQKRRLEPEEYDEELVGFVLDRMADMQIREERSKIEKYQRFVKLLRTEWTESPRKMKNVKLCCKK